MAPSAIGVPVAATPGLVPQADVVTVVAAGALDVVAAGAEVLVLDELLEVLLLLHPAAARAAAARTIIVRADLANIIPLLISPPQGSDFQVPF